LIILKINSLIGYRCQACIRVYRDSKVQAVVERHYHDAMPDLLQTIWLREDYIPRKLTASSNVEPSLQAIKGELKERTKNTLDHV